MTQQSQGHDMMPTVWRCAIRFVIALVLGGILHAGWVALFVTGASLGASGIASGILWLAAPIMTAVGYAVGLTIPVPGVWPVRGRFAQGFVVVCIGCVVGGLIGSPVGPMFVGLGVFGAGGFSALAVVIYAAHRRAGASTDGCIA